MYMIEITESKLDKLTECTEKMLKYGGKIMQVLEELEGGDLEERSEGGSYGSRSMMGSRGNYGGRDNYGGRSYGERGWESEYEDDDPMMRERRGVRGSGRGRR